MPETFRGANGEETDVQGNPWTERHPLQVLRRLKFWQWFWTDRLNELKTPQTPIPKDGIHTVTPNNVTSMQGFIDRHRRQMRGK